MKKRLADGCERLSIGYNEPALYTFLPGLLSVCRRSFPGIRLELREMETLEQIKALQEDELDIGFMRPYGFDLKGLQSKLVYREHYQLAMPGDSPLTVKEKISLEDISRSVLCDKYTLCRDFKKYTGQTVFENLNRYRCIKAAELLNDGKSVAEAALLCGFESFSFFTKTFKKYMGSLPSEYKKRQSKR